MATSVASGSGQLHFQEVFSRGNGCRRTYSVCSIAVKELSWYAISYNICRPFVIISGDLKVFSFFPNSSV